MLDEGQRCVRSVAATTCRRTVQLDVAMTILCASAAERGRTLAAGKTGSDRPAVAWSSSMTRNGAASRCSAWRSLGRRSTPLDLDGTEEQAAARPNHRTLGDVMSKRIVLGIFSDEAAADTAARTLKEWDELDDDVRVNAIGVLVLDDEGKVKTEKLGQRSWGKGAGIGVALAAITPPGLIAGVLAGGVLGGLHHKGLGIDEAQRDRDRRGAAERPCGGRCARGAHAGCSRLAQADRARWRTPRAEPERRSGRRSRHGRARGRRSRRPRRGGRRDRRRAGRVSRTRHLTGGRAIPSYPARTPAVSAVVAFERVDDLSRVGLGGSRVGNAIGGSRR